MDSETGLPTSRSALADDGSGSILGLAVIGVVVAIVALTLPLYIGLAIRQSVAGAADASALAAADVASGIAPGSPCTIAEHLAAANGGRLERCSVDGEVVTVSLARSFLGLQLRATASAGPGDAVTN